MVLINKQPKLSCHMASMPINDRRLIKHVMLICFCSAKFLLKGVNIVSFSNDHRIVSSLTMLKTNAMIGCLRTRVRKQPIIALYFESENELKIYNLRPGLSW